MKKQMIVTHDLNVDVNFHVMDGFNAKIHKQNILIDDLLDILTAINV